MLEFVWHCFNVFQEKRKEFESNPELVDKIIREGNEKARKVAQQTIDEVRQKMGLK